MGKFWILWLNILCLVAGIKWNYLKSINTGDIFKAIITEEKFAKSELYKINNISTLKVVRLGCSLSY